MCEMPGDVERCPSPDTSLAGRACLLHSPVLTKPELNKEPSRRQAAGLVHAGSGSAASSEEGTVVWEPQSQVPPSRLTALTCLLGLCRLHTGLAARHTCHSGALAFQGWLPARWPLASACLPRAFAQPSPSPPLLPIQPQPSLLALHPPPHPCFVSPCSPYTCA